MIDDQSIRAAYEAIAATAPVPERVRARLAARRRVHQQRRALLVGAGALGTAAVATGVGLPLVVRSRQEEAGVTPGVQTGVPAGATGSAPPVMDVVEVPFRFAPTWLPDRVTEQFRSVKTTMTGGKGLPAGGTRHWLPAGARYPDDAIEPVGVSLAIDERIDDNSGQPVRIGSVTGILRVTDASYVQWRPAGAPTLLVSVYGLPDATATALRVARSVAAGSAGMRVAMRSPWVPERFIGSVVASVFPTATGWRQKLTHSSPDNRRSCTVVATTGPAPKSTACQVSRPDGVTLYVPEVLVATSRGTGAVGSGAPTRQEMMRMLDELVYAVPDLSWVGSR